MTRSSSPRVRCSRRDLQICLAGLRTAHRLIGQGVEPCIHPRRQNALDDASQPDPSCGDAESRLAERCATLQPARQRPRDGRDTCSPRPDSPMEAPNRFQARVFRRILGRTPSEEHPAVLFQGPRDPRRDREAPPDRFPPDINKKIRLACCLHWAFKLYFVACYLLTFWVRELLIPFLLLVVVTAILWIPFMDCPLLVWENRLRGRANLPARRFFGLNAIVDSLLGRRLGIRLPNDTTLVVIAVLVLVRILLWRG